MRERSDEQPDSCALPRYKVPAFTKWETIWKCGKLSLHYVPSIGKYFLNHWEMKLVIPILVQFTIWSSYVVYITCERGLFPEKFNTEMTLFLTITATLFAWSYISTIALGPGYLPYYYPLMNQRSGKIDYMDGMITTTSQLAYMKAMHLPERTKYFRSARRIVIRPDHYCVWVRSFIGRKNHKQFFLFNLYGVIYTAAFTSASVKSVIPLFKNREDDVFWPLLVTALYTLFGAAFCLFTLIFVVTMLYEISVDLTSFEQMKKSEREKRFSRWISNWEYLFGPIEKWYTWMIPIDPFNVRDDSDLVDDEYYDYEYSN